MRVLLIGTLNERNRVRRQLEQTGVRIVGEFGTRVEAKSSAIDADALILAADADEQPPRSRSDLEVASATEALTPRELQVLALLAEGLSNKSIAAELGISDQTVKFHVAAIIGKLGASNRTEAVRRGLRRGLIAL
jgi:DNA-binding NarL/FixJ family response regulator